MADVKLSKIAGGGGYFKIESFVHSQDIAFGQTGDLVTIGTAGKVTRLTYFTCKSGATQTGITVSRDGFDVMTGELEDYSPTAESGRIGVYSGLASDFTKSRTGILDYIEGEFITISKDAGNTAQILIYSYVTGEYGS